MSSIRRLYTAMTVLSPIGLAASSYLLYLHFKPEASTICKLSERFDCDIVNKSPYSEIFGIPVALIGILVYFALFLFALRGKWRDQTKLLPWVLLCTSGAVLFSLYLTGVEAFILRAFCLFCLTQQIVILLEWLCVFKLYSLTKKA